MNSECGLTNGWNLRFDVSIGPMVLAGTVGSDWDSTILPRHSYACHMVSECFTLHRKVPASSGR